MNNIGVFFFISLTFSPLAAACAFLITYEEYKKHLRKNQVIHHALHSALFTFIVFIILGLTAGFIFNGGF